MVLNAFYDIYDIENFQGIRKKLTMCTHTIVFSPIPLTFTTTAQDLSG